MTIQEAEKTAVALLRRGCQVAGVIHCGDGYGVALVNGDWTDEPWSEQSAPAQEPSAPSGNEAIPTGSSGA